MNIARTGTASTSSRPGLQPADLCNAAVTLFPILYFFNDRLEQRDLGNYKTDLNQIFRVVDTLV